jgi:Na+-driven multidrug efflux pump
VGKKDVVPMDQKQNAFLETEKLTKLMGKYSIPCVISLVVGALYNIVDQIFIANADYLGSYGNAANTVVFPLTVLTLAIAVMIGDGCCAFVSIALGCGNKEEAHRSVGNSIVLCLVSSLVLTAIYLIFMESILTLFGGKVNVETYAFAKEYFFWIALGIPFYMFGQAMNPVIRSDGSAAASTVISLIREIIFGVFFPIILPIFMGLDGLLWSFPVSDILTFVITYFFIRQTYRELSDTTQKRLKTSHIDYLC